ncbi:MAG: succinyl-diaminopimelate desuccinylase [Ferrovibrio sp.]|uniref:succinyl-diaminopimelate desuccinylase n=1 Tax=Ferrovibrio sp. TaxID=1917215 RepID=UPI00260EFCC8|nr:succinyl-diaminopimelate desuccinylase [Ferrovibrio sp.]MCW0233643.1 succinyl-diaminopimelate desuccinylase [Ferrovibrio sp.]
MSAAPLPPQSLPDPVTLAQDLIRCPSVTPADQGALGVLEAALVPLGFRCERLKFSASGTPDVENLYARWGEGEVNFCFAGHTDVVPVGDHAAWTADPFGAEIRDGQLYGRGATDMKSAIAAFAAAAGRFIAARQGQIPGGISLLITGDEEGPAINGTTRVLDWLKEKGETLSVCVVGEPTNPLQLGEMMKIGRRGSLTARLTVHGVQGHVGYPHLADNPIPKLLDILSALKSRRLDTGNAHFEPSNLEITSIDVGNPANNVIPANAKAVLNIRYNTEQSSEGLKSWITRTCEAICGGQGENRALLGTRFDLVLEDGAKPFLTAPGPFVAAMAEAVKAGTGRMPELSTTGGTSDARFIQAYCPVVEFGLVGQTMHKVDERAGVEDIRALSKVYEGMLQRFFDGLAA